MNLLKLTWWGRFRWLHLQLFIVNFQELSSQLKEIHIRSEAWTEWSQWSSCSRSCDGGVSHQLRKCRTASCIGERIRYKICNMQVSFFLYCLITFTKLNNYKICITKMASVIDAYVFICFSTLSNIYVSISCSCRLYKLTYRSKKFYMHNQYWAVMLPNNLWWNLYNNSIVFSKPERPINS